ncbi:hypothetical protein BBO99_00005513 [Phytophthora kernoviae]|uniref:PA domain-containing protein n=2 Tax=Phytophthora kernoviae TaxID=325452 RepID=A0A421FCG5_9STRA|nr:hypothetical protein G195_006212 [Phytophthora kernoviae 00238/432]KAG2523442.1 hypothetical protein JM16_005327 [Phytophthora kernoviae]KAG2525304.1 hypothetical protein JM18_004759 [Phytophthora kernoviae]RLN37265.1 hypothetical protein BBI17_005602 [Phytophthora kernoviae]RLN79104.1 hypothetical protein BBO99_00005513 [Phytophthora kernoviae]
MPDVDLPPPPSTQSFAFVSWVSSNGRRACPLATFGARDPGALTARLACAEPPRADQPELKNASELRGAIVLVVRGGCTFAHKARLLQRAGAVAMVLANNTREEPLAAFTMGESLEDLAENEDKDAQELTLPCVMMCLRDVRELFKKFPPSVKTGALKLEILPSEEAQVIAQECLRIQREQHDAKQAGRGWKAIKSTTSSIFKLLEPQASFSGKFVTCDPLLADKPLNNSEQLRGAVALLKRGSCSFPEKLERVQRAGAVAAIVGNDDSKDFDAAFVMSVDHIDAANATLPSVMVSRRVKQPTDFYLSAGGLSHSQN